MKIWLRADSAVRLNATMSASHQKDCGDEGFGLRRGSDNGRHSARHTQPPGNGVRRGPSVTASLPVFDERVPLFHRLRIGVNCSCLTCSEHVEAMVPSHSKKGVGMTKPPWGSFDIRAKVQALRNALWSFATKRFVGVWNGVPFINLDTPLRKLIPSTGSRTTLRNAESRGIHGRVCFRRSRRQGEVERSAAPAVAVGPNPAAMRFDDRLADCQAHAAAL